MRREHLLLLVLFPGLLALATWLEQRVLKPRADARTPMERVAFWERHAERNPGFAASQAKLGQAYEAVEDYRGAERAYRRALGLDPDLGSAAVGLANALVATNRRDAAAREMAAFIARNPDCRPCALRLASDQLALGQIDEARHTITRVIGAPGRATLYATTPDFDPVVALVLAARIQQEAGDREGSLAYYDQALARAPGHAGAQLQAGRLRLDAEPAAAARHLERYRAAFPGDLRAGLWLGTAHARAGDVAAARAVWRETRSRAEAREDENALRIRARLDQLLASAGSPAGVAPDL